ncbi:MAG: thioredoxin [Lactobacillaceae bacterium]|nr:thioredoxin [Lactobacillaceae bacterium]
MSVSIVNDKNFNEETNKGIVVTDFWAEWCGPCKMQSPVIEDMANNITDVKFNKIDVDQNKDTARNLSIMAIPTLIIKKDGEIVERLTGFHTKEMLLKILDLYRS